MNSFFMKSSAVKTNHGSKNSEQWKETREIMEMFYILAL
jgi:hypothetical protein